MPEDTPMTPTDVNLNQASVDIQPAPRRRRRKASDNVPTGPETTSMTTDATSASQTLETAPVGNPSTSDSGMEGDGLPSFGMTEASETPVPPAPAVTTKRTRKAKPSAEVAPMTDAETPPPPKAKRSRKATATVETAVADVQAVAETPTPTVDPTVEQLQAELGEQIEAVVERVQEQNPDFSPPPFSPAALIDLIRRNLDKFAPRESLALLRRVTSSMGGGDLLDADTWKGIWYMLNYTVQYQGDILKRRLKGEYYTDAYGYDPEFYEVIKPLLDFLFDQYWRVTVHGIEHVPSEGPALLVSNHSGVLPWDGAMVSLAVQKEHPNPRLVRGLYANWFPSLPFLSLILTKMGMVLAHPDNGRRLLNEGELVLVFPEGYKGPSKLFKERYRLQRFGRGGFVQMALETNAPMIPVAVVGSEEIYPVIGRADALGKPFGIPYVPITPLFPWTGLLGAIPLPSKWSITFEPAISTAEYGPARANDMRLVSQLTDEVRARIQGMLYDRLKERKSIFFG